MAYCAYCGSHVPQVSYAPCASCGNPTNGAPPRPKGGGTNPAVIVIVVLFGGLAIIAMIGILAAIAIPNLLTAKQRAMQKRTAADMRMLATAVETYGVAHGAYPADAGELADAPRLDAWGHALKYERTAEGYTITSAGKDGQFDTTTAAGTTQNFDCDIVFSNGAFVQYPDGLVTGRS